MMTTKKIFALLIALFLLVSCKKEVNEPQVHDLTIFFINDPQAQIDNFSKVKYIIDKERQKSDVLVTCGGDIFSGNPVVDNYAEQGYPIIDIMNEVGFDISVVGNHDFDYGKDILSERMAQAEFDWVCANVDMENTGIPQPYEYKTVNIGDIQITILGLIETNGKPGATIPSTHPLKLEGITFERPENVVSQYANLKEQENSDLYIALTHLGHNGYYGTLGDFQLAHQFPYFDLIIGGHSSVKLDTIVNHIPVVQAGSYLHYLGKIQLSLKDNEMNGYHCELIDLNNYLEIDTELQNDIDGYNSTMAPLLNEVIGYAHIYHDRYQVGCFYTDALRERLGVDITFQNTGGIRSPLNQGDITVREIYEIDPFKNGAIIFTMTASEIKSLLMGVPTWFCYSGIEIDQVNDHIELEYLNGNSIPDTAVLTVGVNDYIPAVNDSYFPTGNVQSFTTAEALIDYLKNMNSDVNYPGCNRYFKYQ